MLLRYTDGSLREISDELAIKILADPSDDNNLLELDTHSVNLIIHAAIGTFCDPDKSFDDNVKYLLSKYFIWEPKPQAREDAIELLRRYRNEIKEKEIGIFSADDII